MLFDVADTNACHIILGKPWVYDLNAIYNTKDNTYKFQHNGVLHDDVSNKIPKKLKLLDEVSQARIPDELQPIIYPMQDIPLSNMEVIHGVKKQHVEFDCEEVDMFKFQQDVLFVLGGNSRTSFFKKGRMTQQQQGDEMPMVWEMLLYIYIICSPD
uniref:RNA-directed DNA polymerase n=1 Tax=Tanacetum cinerariifolium TaxID=118510 RepID=A0A699KSN3_TANCI|nr:RNA-directed DNA polymerase [Tanacetum cinerariifolium]